MACISMNLHHYHVLLPLRELNAILFCSIKPKYALYIYEYMDKKWKQLSLEVVKRFEL